MANPFDSNIEQQTELFSALADPTRLKLLRLLSQQKEPDALCVNGLAFRLGVTQPAVSQHLKVLKNAGLVKAERRGYRIHYFINRNAMIEAQATMLQALSVVEDPLQTESEGQEE